MQKVKERIAEARSQAGLSQAVEIVAVTKTHPPELIVEAYQAGMQVIGENRIQEAVAKFAQLPPLEKLQRRMIGHLQPNKINHALNNFDTIDSVDSQRLAGKLDRKAQTRQIKLPVLLEVNTSGEAAKYGFHPDDISAMVDCCHLEGLAVAGLMTIGPLTRDENKMRRAFTLLRNLKDDINRQLEADHPALKTLSMGMSGDFPLAVAEGSTMVRLGTVLFGPRRQLQ